LAGTFRGIQTLKQHSAPSFSWSIPPVVWHFSGHSEQLLKQVSGCQMRISLGRTWVFIAQNRAYGVLVIGRRPSVFHIQIRSPHELSLNLRPICQK
jgi:hypothetical protein